MLLIRSRVEVGVPFETSQRRCRRIQITSDLPIEEYESPLHVRYDQLPARINQRVSLQYDQVCDPWVSRPEGANVVLVVGHRVCTSTPHRHNSSGCGKRQGALT